MQTASAMGYIPLAFGVTTSPSQHPIGRPPLRWLAMATAPLPFSLILATSHRLGWNDGLAEKNSLPRGWNKFGPANLLQTGFLRNIPKSISPVEPPVNYCFGTYVIDRMVRPPVSGIILSIHPNRPSPHSS